MSARKELIAFPTIHSKVPSTSVVFVSEFGKWVTFKGQKMWGERKFF